MEIYIKVAPSKVVLVSVRQSMRISIGRGLQFGRASGLKRLDEIFREGVSANKHTGDTLGELGDGFQTGYGSNMKMILHKEIFSWLLGFKFRSLV